MATILKNAEINEQVSLAGYFTDSINDGPINGPIDRYVEDSAIDLDLIDSVNFTNSILGNEPFKIALEENLQTLCECTKTNRVLITSWLSLDLFLAFLPHSKLSNPVMEQIKAWNKSKIDNVYINWFKKND